MVKYANAGASPNPSRKRKRPANPSVGAKSAIEADHVTVDKVLPRIQNKTNRPHHRTTPPVQSDLPETSLHPSPSSPHAILEDNDDDEAPVFDKAKSKLEVRALRNARAEVCSFESDRVGKRTDAIHPPGSEVCQQWFR